MHIAISTCWALDAHKHVLFFPATPSCMCKFGKNFNVLLFYTHTHTRLRH